MNEGFEMSGGTPEDDAVPPTMSRKHASGAISARGLLFTVLGEFVLPGTRSVWTSTVIRVLGRLGIEEKATRQALIRTAADGWLTQHRQGRRTRWQLTSQAEALLRDGTERIYGFTGVMPRWDGWLVLVLVRVPEADRSSRHALRTRLSWAGFGSPAPGVWISTHTDRVSEVEALFRETGVTDARIFSACHLGGADLKSMVKQAWELDSVEDRYRSFLDDFAGWRTNEPLTRLVELVHRWRRFPSVDPALPRELLPSRWSGESAAQLFIKRHASWSAPARVAWEEINASSA